MKSLLCTIHEAAKYQSAISGFQLESSEIKEAILAFVANIEQFHQFAALPVSLFGLGGWIQEEWSKAAENCTNRAFEEDDTKRMDVQEELKRSVENCHVHNDTLRHRFESLTRCTDVLGQDSDEESFVDDGLRAFLSAQTILCWTLFEATAKDIWIAALNSRTCSLGTNIAKNPHGGNSNEGKQIKLSELERHGWNVVGKLGTIYSYKYDFSRCEECGDAYYDAFRDDSFRKLFASQELRRLNAIRNLFVHKAGIIDEKFITQSRIPGLKVGAVFRTSPADVSSLCKEAIDILCNLAKLVDQWLKANPK
jgi:hypothetical protein